MLHVQPITFSQTAYVIVVDAVSAIIIIIIVSPVVHGTQNGKPCGLWHLVFEFHSFSSNRIEVLKPPAAT